MSGTRRGTGYGVAAYALWGLFPLYWPLLEPAGAVAVNWDTFIWGVTRGHVVETSLGYFVTPLVTVLLGVIVLRERLRRAHWAAVTLAAVAVLVLTVESLGHRRRRLRTALAGSSA